MFADDIRIGELISQAIVVVALGISFIRKTVKVNKKYY